MIYQALMGDTGQQNQGIEEVEFWQDTCSTQCWVFLQGTEMGLEHDQNLKKTEPNIEEQKNLIGYIMFWETSLTKYGEQQISNGECV